jgi:predicted nuclease with TOPRIM domain
VLLLLLQELQSNLTQVFDAFEEQQAETDRVTEIAYQLEAAVNRLTEENGKLTQQVEDLMQVGWGQGGHH